MCDVFGAPAECVDSDGAGVRVELTLIEVTPNTSGAVWCISCDRDRGTGTVSKTKNNPELPGTIAGKGQMRSGTKVEKRHRDTRVGLTTNCQVRIHIVF